MTNPKLFPQVTYDEEVEAGYIYLTAEFAQCNEMADQTETLDENPNILLDLNANGVVIGLEFLPPVSDRLRPYRGENGVFLKRTTPEDDVYYTFQIKNGDALVWVWVNKIAFLFEDIACSLLLGVEVHDDSSYSELYLVGETSGSD